MNQDNASTESIGKFSRHHESIDQFEGISVTSDPSSSKLPQSAVMLRGFTLGLLKNTIEELGKESSTRKVVLDGEAGVGKSAVLNQVASHFLSLDHIVWMLPRPGKEFYAKESEGFTQSALASTVLKQFLQMNSALLAKIQVKGTHEIGKETFKGSLEKLVELGVSNQESSHQVLNATVSELVENSTDRPPVVFIIDQLNAFYTKTAYNDTDSSVITSDKFQLVQSFYKVLQQPSLKNAAVLAATDRTDPFIRSPYLDTLLSIHQNDRRKGAKYEDLQTVDPFGVVLPEKLDLLSNDGFAGKDVAPKGLERLDLKGLDRSEVESLLEMLSEEKVFHGKLSKNIVEKALLLSGGNAKRLVSLAPTLK
ncbi:28S ribosomal protein S29, mitochondrial [Phlyctochytrium planicorne]|nr:28S ribosomal protein S29, mitochondrial [Phlyctochytrium planicorne]